MDNQSNQQKDKQNRTNPFKYLCSLGFFGGVIFGGIGLASFYLGFTNVVRGFMIEPFFKHTFLSTWYGQLLGVASLIVCSILGAFLYYAIAKKVIGPWFGLFYGVIWSFIIVLWPAPMLGLFPRASDMNVTGYSLEISLILLWGLFVGYSIAVEFNDESSREPVVKTE